METEVSVKKSIYQNYEELPLCLNSETVAKTLGVSPSSAYELMHEPDFPVLRIGNRMVGPKEQFIQWVGEHTEGGEHNRLCLCTRVIRSDIACHCPTKSGSGG